jgi:hypothetical protein
MMWRRWRFVVHHEDWRPVIFPPPGPCWKSGEDGAGREEQRQAKALYQRFLARERELHR